MAKVDLRPLPIPESRQQDLERVAAHLPDGCYVRAVWITASPIFELWVEIRGVRASRVFLLDDTAAAVRALEELGDALQRGESVAPAQEWFRARQ